MPDRSANEHTLFLLIADTALRSPLTLVVGPHGAGKTRLLRLLARQTGYPLYPLSLELSQALRQVLPEARARQVPVALREGIAALRSNIVLVDRIELLFTPALRSDPLRLLRQVSRLCSLVVAWPGSYENDCLTYAEPGHPEFRSYPHPGIPIFPLGGESDALP